MEGVFGEIKQLNRTESILSSIFGGKTLDELRNKCLCTKCKVIKSSWKELEPHHITYKPDVVKYLCHSCHARITFLNHKRANEVHRRLDIKERKQVWNNFLIEEVDQDTITACVQWFNNHIYRK